MVPRRGQKSRSAAPLAVAKRRGAGAGRLRLWDWVRPSSLSDRAVGRMGLLPIVPRPARPNGERQIAHNRASRLTGPEMLIAGYVYWRRTGHHPARNLRCDQECRNDGGHAYQSQDLIHRKHRLRPQNDRRQRLVRPLRGLLIAGQDLVCIGRSGNREQRQKRNDGQRFHAAIVVFDCGQKRQCLAHFQDEPENNRGFPPASTRSPRRRVRSVSPAGRARAPWPPSD
jgi:hypothetical protein